jgi:cell wall-associated NlpC family hydrolase
MCRVNLNNTKFMTEKIWIIISFIFVLAGCSLVPDRNTYSPQTGGTYSESIKKKLYAQYTQWRGTKYKLGGLNKKGIDCSGFVFVTYKSKLGKVLPRTTHLQVTVGSNVKRNELQAGDLVFFKTGKFKRHVGIYLEHGKFLHASTSNGVTISRLENNYWKSRYWRAKRIKS